MTCKTCGREGLCDVCCCISTDHRNALRKTCHLCGHAVKAKRR